MSVLDLLPEYYDYVGFTSSFQIQTFLASFSFIHSLLETAMSPYTVNSRYSGPLNCGHLDIAATYLGTDLKLHQDCTNLVSDLRSPRYSVLQPLLETPISAIVFILQPEVMFVGVVMVKT